MRYLPEWLDEGADLFVDGESWRMCYALGMDPGWSEAWQRGLVKLLQEEPEGLRDGSTWGSAPADVKACIEYLRWTGLRLDGKPRQGKSAEITRSLREQLVDWLETPESERTYFTPFSVKQWNRCVRTKFTGYGGLMERCRRVAEQLRVDEEAGGEVWPERAEDLVPKMVMGKVDYYSKRKVRVA